LSRSGSREGLGNGSESDNWRDRNGGVNGLPGHDEFPSVVGSPKRKQNKSGQLSTDPLARNYEWTISQYITCWREAAIDVLRSEMALQLTLPASAS